MFKLAGWVILCSSEQKRSLIYIYWPKTSLSFLQALPDLYGLPKRKSRYDEHSKFRMLEPNGQLPRAQPAPPNISQKKPASINPNL